MLLIVAHHYVVCSDLPEVIFADHFSFPLIFVLLFGAWGKTGINCFVLITGYFMCKSQITAKKFFKLIFEICFYSTIVYLIFALTGYTNFSLKGFILSLCPFVRTDGYVFITSYPVFYLFIPFLNCLVRNISKRTHLRLILASLAIFSLWASIPTFEMPHEYILWFSVLYFISSYIRIYPEKIFDNTKFWGIATTAIFILASISVIGMTFLADKFNKLNSFYYPYWFISDSNKIFAVLLAFAAFMFFKNLKIKQSRFINTVAASSFGVLLIHDGNSAIMKRWLWCDTLNNAAMYASSWMILHAVVSVLAVYTVCTVVDYLRIRFLEKPFFKFWDAHYDSVYTHISVLSKRLTKSLVFRISKK